MPTNRLLFVRPGRKTGLAPIYFAIFLLVGMSVVGFAYALWPEDRARVHRPLAREATPANRARERAPEFVPPAPDPRGRGRWM